MAGPTRARLVRLGALAALTVPTTGALLLLGASPALADYSPSTLSCPKSDGTPGGRSVAGTGQSCGAFSDSVPTTVTAVVSCGVICLSEPQFVLTSPSGSTLFSRSLGPGSTTYVLPAGAPPGTYVAALRGGGANVSATLVLQDPPPPATSNPEPTATASPDGAAPSTGPTTTPSAGTSASTPSGTPSPGTTASAGAAPSGGPGTGPSAGPGAAGTRHHGVATLPALLPPAGIMKLPPLPPLPGADPDGAPVSGPYGKTLPYDGSVTVTQKDGTPAVVADTIGNRQVAESVAAACLALLFAAHVRRFTRHPSGDADL